MDLGLDLRNRGTFLIRGNPLTRGILLFMESSPGTSLPLQHHRLRLRLRLRLLPIVLTRSFNLFVTPPPPILSHILAMESDSGVVSRSARGRDATLPGYGVFDSSSTLAPNLFLPHTHTRIRLCHWLFYDDSGLSTAASFHMSRHQLASTSGSNIHNRRFSPSSRLPAHLTYRFIHAYAGNIPSRSIIHSRVDSRIHNTYPRPHTRLRPPSRLRTS